MFLKARMILDAYVMLPTNNFGMALVTSRKQLHNPKSEWAFCNCPYAQRGNICKHQVKALQLLHPKVAKNTITCYCGVMKVTIHGGLQNLLNPT